MQFERLCEHLRCSPHGVIVDAGHLDQPVEVDGVQWATYEHALVVGQGPCFFTYVSAAPSGGRILLGVALLHGGTKVPLEGGVIGDLSAHAARNVD